MACALSESRLVIKRASTCDTWIVNCNKTHFDNKKLDHASTTGSIGQAESSPLQSWGPRFKTDDFRRFRLIDLLSRLSNSKGSVYLTSESNSIPSTFKSSQAALSCARHDVSRIHHAENESIPHHQSVTLVERNHHPLVSRKVFGSKWTQMISTDCNWSFDPLSRPRNQWIWLRTVLWSLGTGFRSEQLETWQLGRTYGRDQWTEDQTGFRY